MNKQILKLISELEVFQPYCEFENIDRLTIIKFLKDYEEEAFDRNNFIGHMTASCMILNEDMTKVLMGYHLIYDSYGWLGGHSDMEFNTLVTSTKELEEESGIKNAKLLSDKIISVEVLPVPSHIKKGKAVPHHMHYNVTYGYIASTSEKLFVKEDENSSLKWIDIDEIEKYVKEIDMIPVYKKIISKMKSIGYK